MWGSLFAMEPCNVHSQLDIASLQLVADTCLHRWTLLVLQLTCDNLPHQGKKYLHSLKTTFLPSPIKQPVPCRLESCILFLHVGITGPGPVIIQDPAPFMLVTLVSKFSAPTPGLQFEKWSIVTLIFPRYLRIPKKGSSARGGILHKPMCRHRFVVKKA
jgi:hypothetical protein